MGDVAAGSGLGDRKADPLLAAPDEAAICQSFDFLYQFVILHKAALKYSYTEKAFIITYCDREPVPKNSRASCYEKKDSSRTGWAARPGPATPGSRCGRPPGTSASDVGQAVPLSDGEIGRVGGKADQR